MDVDQMPVHELRCLAQELLAERERYRRLSARVRGALEHTRPPAGWRGEIACYGGPGKIEAEPYAWLYVLVAEALASDGAPPSG